MASASSLFPELMRVMNASRSACIHPHSMAVSSLCPLGGVLPPNFVLNCSNLRSKFSYFFMTCDRVSVFDAIRPRISLNSLGLSLHLVSSHAAAVYFVNLSSGICWPGLVHRVRSKVSVTRTVPCGRKSSSIGMAQCSFGRGCFRIMRLMCSNFFIIVSVVSEFVARSVFVSARGCPRL